MNMLGKCIALSTTVATSLLLASCATRSSTTEVVTIPPDLLVDNARVPTAAELYSDRYRTGVTQVRDGDRIRFVECPTCAGATPKTSVVNVQEAARRKAREALVERERAKAQAAARRTQAEAAAARTVSTGPSATTSSIKPSVQPAVFTTTVPTQTTPTTRPIQETPKPTPPIVTDSTPVAFAKGVVSGVAASVPRAASGLSLEFAEDLSSEPLNDLGEPLDVVIFRGGSAWLDTKSEDQLRQLADAWTAASSAPGVESRPLLIVGYTDSSPTKTPSFNEYLARRRAEVVREVLLRHGVPEDAMKVDHHVQCCYVADNQTAEGRAKNRRTEIHVL